MGDSCIKPLSWVETCKNFINVTLFWFYGDQMSIYKIIWNASLLDSFIKLERFGPGAKESTFLPDLSSLPPFPLWTLGLKTETIYWIYHSRPLGVDTLSPEPVPVRGWEEFILVWVSSFEIYPTHPRKSIQLSCPIETVKWSEVKVAQLCPTLCYPMDYIVHGILQARILEWVAYPFSRGSSQPRDWTWVSCIAGRFFTSWATGWGWGRVGRSIIRKTDKTRFALFLPAAFPPPWMAPQHTLKIKDCIYQYSHKQLRIKYVLC